MRASSVPRPTLLYIAGEGRSGSTVLGDVLGAYEDMVHVGEVRYLWDRGVRQNRSCGCSESFHACPWWTTVMERAFSGIDGVDAEHMLRNERVLTGLRRAGPETLVSSPALTTDEFQTYTANLEKLYAAIHHVSKAETIVDSSKSAEYLFALANLRNVRLVVVHLVRDPRAVAFSWARRRTHPDGANGIPMNRFRADRSARRWNRVNGAVETVCRRQGLPKVELRYEDFVAQPRSSLDPLMGQLGGRRRAWPFASDHRVALGANHTVWGNPSRFVRGAIDLRADDEWKQHMRCASRIVVSVLTARSRVRYGY